MQLNKIHFFSKFACACQLLVVLLNGPPSLKFFMRTQLICCSNHYLLFRSHLVSNSSGSIQLNKTQTHPSWTICIFSPLLKHCYIAVTLTLKCCYHFAISSSSFQHNKWNKKRTSTPSLTFYLHYACQVIYARYQPQDTCPDQLLHSFMTEVSIIGTFLYDRDLRHERVKINCNLWSSSMGCNDAIFEWHLARNSVILNQLAFSRTPFDYGSSFADQISFDKDLDVQMVFWIFQ